MVEISPCCAAWLEGVRKETWLLQVKERAPGVNTG
jgi:hypothetical protein